jgi:predicted Zn-dependent protease
MKSFRLISSLITLSIALLSIGCSTVPETGRRQLSLVSASEETQLGITSFNQMKQETPISKDPEVNALLQKVGKRIAAVAPLPNAQWEFVVFESKEANAFCLPGGKVGVYTGILAITKDEGGLATVVGHEVGHAVAHHGAERMSQQMLQQTGGAALATGLSSTDPRLQAAATTVYGLGSQVGVMLPYSRKHESEADELGLIYMARAGYDPEAAVLFWQRFADYNRAAGDTTPTIFRTHPTNKSRIEQIQAWLPKAKAQYKPAN